MVKKGKVDLPHPYLHHATNKIVQPLVLTAMTTHKGKDYVWFFVCLFDLGGRNRALVECGLFFYAKEKKVFRTVVNMGRGIQKWTKLNLRKRAFKNI